MRSINSPVIGSSMLYFVLVSICLASCNNKIILNNTTITPLSFGAIPNDNRDDTRAFQKCVDFAIKRKIQKIFIPAGVYDISSVNVSYGLKIFGEKGSILKKMPYSKKFDRTFTTGIRGYTYKGIKDSPLLEFKNLEFDGNFTNQGPYVNYELEHQHSIFLMADENFPGRLKAKIDSCYFYNGVADGVSIYKHVDAEVINCSAENVFRGAVTITGGNSKVLINSLVAKGDVHSTGIDIEIDGESKTHGYHTEVTAKNLWLKGDFDISGGPSGSFIGDSIYCESAPFRVHYPGGVVRITNSTFKNLYSEQSRIIFPANVSFQDCNFHFNSDEKDKYGIEVFFNAPYHKSDQGKLSFNKCTFIGENQQPKTFTSGIFNQGDESFRNNQIIIENSVFKGKFNYPVFLDLGGNLIMENVEFEKDYTLKFISLGKNHSYHKYNVSLKGLKTLNNKKINIEYFDLIGNIIDIKEIEKFEFKSTNLKTSKTIIKSTGKFEKVRRQ